MGRPLPMYAAPRVDAETLDRIKLERRGKLRYNSAELARVSSRLASSADDRREFLARPAQYLVASGIAVDTASLASRPLETSEMCSVGVAICVVEAAAVFDLAVAATQTAVGFAQVVWVAVAWCKLGAWIQSICGENVEPANLGGMTAVMV